MKIDLQHMIETTEALLAGMRELDGTEIDEQARGRAARERRTDVSMSLQALAYQADVVRVTLTGVHLSLRDRGRNDTAPGPEVEG